MKISKPIFLLIFSIMICFSGFAVALDSTIFTPNENDLSVQILGMIFGDYVGAINLKSPAIPFVSEMFKIVNSVVLSIASIVVSYIGIVATVHTSHEGEVMGKKWSSIWIPARSLIGTLFMVPTPGSGYSMAQISIMWCILQGIGAADSLWGEIMDNMKSGMTLNENLTAASSEGDVKFKDNIDKDFNIKTAINPNFDDNSPSADYSEENLLLRMFRSQVCLQAIKHIADGSAKYINLPSGSPPIENTANAGIGNVASLSNTSETAGINEIVNTIKNNPLALKHNITLQSVATANVKKDLASSYGLSSYSTAAYINYGIGNNPDGTDHLSAKNICGSITITANVGAAEVADLLEDPDASTIKTKAEEILEAAISAKIEALNVVNLKLQVLASKYVDAYNNKKNEKILSDLEIDNMYTALVDMKRTYIKRVFLDADGLRSSKFSKKDNEFTEAVKSGQNSGWIVAGGYYWYLTKGVQQKFLETAKDKVGDYNFKKIPHVEFADAFKKTTEDIQKTTSKDYFTDIMKDISDNLWQRFVDLNATKNNGNGTNIPVFSIKPMKFENENANAVLEPIAELQQKMTTLLTEALTGGIGADGRPTRDALLSIMIFGTELMFSTEVAYLATLTIILAVYISIAVASVTVLGTGVGGAIEPITQSLNLIFGIVASLFALLWGLGATLGAYVPMIPYLMFSLSAIGWIMLVVEAMVAAPIFALSLVLPSGEELGKFSTGIGLLTGIVLRPLLMIVGLIMAIQVCKAIIFLINKTFISAMPPMASMFSFFVVFGTYVSLVVALVNKSFALIHIVPDKVLRWAGISSEQTDVSAMQEVQKGAESAASKGQKAVSNIGSDASSATGAKAEQFNKDDKAAKEEKNKNKNAEKSEDGNDPSGLGGGDAGDSKSPGGDPSGSGSESPSSSPPTPSAGSGGGSGDTLKPPSSLPTGGDSGGSPKGPGTGGPGATPGGTPGTPPTAASGNAAASSVPPEAAVAAL